MQLKLLQSAVSGNAQQTFNFAHKMTVKGIGTQTEKNMFTLRTLESAIQHQIESKDSSALMINGAWGSGKTHFIKKCLPDHSLYLSAYGLLSRGEIKDRLFESISGIDDVSESEISKAGNFISNLGKIFGDIDSSSGAIGALSSVVGSTIKSKILAAITASTVVIIDDLERFEGDITVALSFINELVEHQNLNVVVLCDENSIKANNKEGYYSSKEKVIRHTYNLSLSAKEKSEIAFSEVVCSNSYFSQQKDLLASSIECLEDSLNIFKTDNLRTIKFAVGKYVLLSEEVFPKVSNREVRELRFLMVACLVFSIGYKDKRLSIEELEVIATLSDRETIQSGKQSEVFDTYSSYIYNNNRHPIAIPSICKFICGGHLDTESLYKDSFIQYLISTEPEARTLGLFFYELGDCDFKEGLSSIINRIRTGDITGITSFDPYNTIQRVYWGISTRSYDYKLSDFFPESYRWFQSIVDQNENSTDYFPEKYCESEAEFKEHMDKLRDYEADTNKAKEEAAFNIFISSIGTRDRLYFSEYDFKELMFVQFQHLSKAHVLTLFDKISGYDNLRLGNIYNFLQLRYLSTNAVKLIETEQQSINLIVDYLKDIHRTTSCNIALYSVHGAIDFLENRIHSLEHRQLLA